MPKQIVGYNESVSSNNLNNGFWYPSANSCGDEKSDNNEDDDEVEGDNNEDVNGLVKFEEIIFVVASICSIIIAV